MGSKRQSKGLLAHILPNLMMSYSSSRLDEINQEAKDLRERSMLELQQKYARENAEFEQELSDGSEQRKWDRDRAAGLEDEKRKRGYANEDAARAKQDTIDLYKAQTDESIRADKGKRGTTGDLINDLRSFGFEDEEIKSYLLAKDKKSSGMSTEEQAKLRWKTLEAAREDLSAEMSQAKTPQERQRAKAQIKQLAKEYYNSAMGIEPEESGISSTIAELAGDDNESSGGGLLGSIKSMLSGGEETTEDVEEKPEEDEAKPDREEPESTIPMTEDIKALKGSDSIFYAWLKRRYADLSPEMKAKAIAEKKRRERKSFVKERPY